MSGEWILVFLISIPTLIFAYLRYRLVKRWSGKNKAAVTAGILLVTLSLGIYKRHEAIASAHRQDPQAFRYSANPILRRLFSSGAAPVTVSDSKTAHEVFTYYRNDGAARLVSLEHDNETEWLATLSVNASEPQNARLQGMFEKNLDDDARVLPMTRVFRAWSGTLRVEDVQTGQTLFSYAEDSPLRPVSVTKHATAAGIYEWKVLFASSSGLLSQQ